MSFLSDSHVSSVYVILKNSNQDNTKNLMLLYRFKLDIGHIHWSITGMFRFKE